MEDWPELAIEIFPQEGGRYLTRLRFSEPGSAGEAAPVSGVALFDEAALRELRRSALDPQAHGRALRKIWLDEPGLLPAWSEGLRRLGGQARLRLQIDPAAAWLHALRWETLRDADDQDFVALNANLPFSRFLYSADSERIELRPKRDLRALLLAANPVELLRPGGYTLLTGGPPGPDGEPGGVTLAPVDVAGEIGRARALLSELDVDVLAGPLPDGSAIPGALGRPTFERLADCLRSGYDVVYLVAHGSLGVQSSGVQELQSLGVGNLELGAGRAEEAFVLLEKEDGAAQRVSGAALAACIHNLSAEARPRLAALASCQSGGRGRVPAAARDPGESDEEERSYDRGALAALGPLLVQAGVPAVIAMQANVKMETSQRFMQTFFAELLRRGRIDQAAAPARSLARARPDWWAPVVYLRLRSGVLFPAPDGRPLGRLPSEPETVYIPAGEFQSFGVERTVHLPAYRIGKYPVTNGEYREFLRAVKRMPPPELGWAGQNPPDGEERFPVRGVTWFEALEYCRWLGAQTGRACGLPSEGQWLRAAFGPAPACYPWGGEWQAGRCNSGAARPAAVDAFPPQSACGAFDWVGNVLQWTTTLWGEQRLAPDPCYAPPWQPDGRDDLNVNRQVRRVALGSSYKDDPSECVRQARRSFLPDDRGQPGKRLGFRIVYG